jgi:site-specific DNA recombinase
MTKKVVAYIRVSTEEQASCGHSLDNQETRIKAYATALELDTPVSYIDAGYSAKSLDRPNMRALMADVTMGNVKTVIIYKLDRLTRSVVDLGRLVDLFNKHNVALISVSESLDTSTASGRMFINLLGVLSQWERETISERVTTTLDHLRTTGKVYTGSTPYGYTRGRTARDLVKDETQQQTLRTLEELKECGWSYGRMAGYLNLAKVPARNGGKWHASSVHSVLNSRMATA